MPTSAVGTRFLRGDGATSEQFTAIAEINNIDGPNMTRKTLDTTSLDTVGGYSTFIGGFRDGGQVTLDMNFTNAGYSAMKDDFEDDQPKHYQIRIPDTEKSQLAFSALVTDLGTGFSTGDKVNAKVTIKVSGQVVVSAWTT